MKARKMNYENLTFKYKNGKKSYPMTKRDIIWRLLDVQREASYSKLEVKQLKTQRILLIAFLAVVTAIYLDQMLGVLHV